MLKLCRQRAIIEKRRALTALAHYRLRRNSDLWAALSRYLSETKSTGCSWLDYWELNSAIRRYKPAEVLECGTGVSTLIIAHALMENGSGRCTSMEQYADWFDMSRRLLPQPYQPFVDFIRSDVAEDAFNMFRGMRYVDTPDRPYDFIFVDGPSYKTPDGQPTFCFDALWLIRRSEGSVRGLIDKRVSTCFVLQQILGSDKLRYCPVRHIGYIGPASRNDVAALETAISGANFARSYRLIAPTRLRLGRRIEWI